MIIQHYDTVTYTIHTGVAFQAKNEDRKIVVDTLCPEKGYTKTRFTMTSEEAISLTTTLLKVLKTKNE